MSEHPPEQPQTPPEPGHRHWFPRGALVFFALVAVLVFLLVLLRPSWFGRDDDSQTSTSGTTFEQDLAGLGQPQGISLSDDNATSSSFTMAVPRDSRLHNATLTLAGRTQSSEPGTVFLRVLVDGTSQYVGQLADGEEHLDVDVPVPDDALDDGSIKVQVRLTGSLDQQRCNIDQSLGALVVLDGDKTRLHGSLDDRLHSVRDLVAGLEHDVTLDLALPTSGADAQAWFETAAQLGVALTQEGHEVSYADVTDDLSGDDGSHVLVGPADAVADLGWDADGDATGSVQVGEVDDVAHLAVTEPSADVVPTFLATDAVTTADAEATSPRSLEVEQLGGNRVSLASLGANTDVQQLTSSRSWRVPYSLADLPGGAVPRAVRLGFQVPAASADTRWVAQVQLNGRLVASPELDGPGQQQVTVALPAGQELLRNQLTVTLLRDRDLGGCQVRQTTYAVQLLPESSLVLGGRGAGFTGIPATFADGFDLDLPASSTDSPAETLTSVVPTLAEFSGWQQVADTSWDGTPGDRPFLAFGPVPDGVRAPVTLADGRLAGAGFDLQAFDDGLVVERATTSAGVTGLVVTATGDTAGAVVPAYGREVARVVATAGGGFVVTESGRVVSVPPTRAETTP